MHPFKPNFPALEWVIQSWNWHHAGSGFGVALVHNHPNFVEFSVRRRPLKIIWKEAPKLLAPELRRHITIFTQMVAPELPPYFPEYPCYQVHLPTILHIIIVGYSFFPRRNKINIQIVMGLGKGRVQGAKSLRVQRSHNSYFRLEESCGGQWRCKLRLKEGKD